MIQQSHFCMSIQENWKQHLKETFVSQVQSITIHNSQKVKVTEMPIDRMMDEENVVCT